MDTADWNRVEDLFLAALEVDPGDRTRFLRERCGGSDPLFREVSAMLQAAGAGSALRIEGLFLAGEDVPGSLIGRRIGSYRLLERIGRGGMGDVYLAERADEQYRQQVAVKLVRPGFPIPEMTTRFRAERQILARLIHPNIAALLDGGVTAEGLPFLVMQHVAGVPITVFCDQRKLGVRERLHLFRQVCTTVQYAHANLVVHRDLKPSNILVTAEGQPILLDFGIAKLLEERGPDEAAPDTRLDQRILTPEYAAPEQIQGGAVTTAADVYSLGILLYELLTGERPYPLGGRTPSEIERIVCEAEPVPPSLAAGPRARARRVLRGDLDRMVLMALRKDPARRYASAGQFAEDVQRHLGGRPVLAQKDTAGYRVGKFVRRNTLGVGAAAAIVLLVAAFGVVASLQARRLAVERDRARSESQKAERVADFLVELFQTNDPVTVPGGDTLRVGTLLERSEENVEKLADQPAVQARMWFLLGSINLARGRLERARGLFERALTMESALGETHTGEAAQALHSLALSRLQGEGQAPAEPLLRESLALQRRLHGASHLDVAQAMQDLGAAVTDPEEGESLLTTALAMKRKVAPDDDMAIASGLNALAGHYYETGRFEEARSLYEECLQRLGPVLPEGHPHHISVRTNLAAVRLASGDWAGAEEIQRALVDLSRRSVGPETGQTAGAMEALAVTLATRGKHAEAESLLWESLGISRRLLPPRHPRLVRTLRNLGNLLALEGRGREGLAQLREALAILQETEGPAGRGTASLEGLIGFQHLDLGEIGAAAPLIVRAAEVLERLDSERGSKELSDALFWRGELCLRTGDAVQAEQFYRRAAEYRRRTLPRNHPLFATLDCALGTALAAQGRSQESRDLLRESLPIYAAWGQAIPSIRARARAALDSTGDAPSRPPSLRSGRDGE